LLVALAAAVAVTGRTRHGCWMIWLAGRFVIWMSILCRAWDSSWEFGKWRAISALTYILPKPVTSCITAASRDRRLCML
jgi:hypothetical protein